MKNQVNNSQKEFSINKAHWLIRFGTLLIFILIVSFILIISYKFRYTFSQKVMIELCFVDALGVDSLKVENINLNKNNKIEYSNKGSVGKITLIEIDSLKAPSQSYIKISVKNMVILNKLCDIQINKKLNYSLSQLTKKDTCILIKSLTENSIDVNQLLHR